MFEDYKDIFNLRGTYYHQAMIDYPLARKQEFEQIVNLAEIDDRQVICDVPSGGSYLSNFISKDVKIISVETSAQFSKYSQPSERNIPLLAPEIDNIPLVSGTVDRIISLAGLHHISNRISFYRECDRFLKNAGILAIADAKVGSNVGGFLNIFVDRHNSMGHQGDFLSEDDKKSLEKVGFNVVYDSSIAYYWEFDSIKSMVNFCQLLFGIDKATESQILGGIEEYLGYQMLDNKYYMNWELYFLKAIKLN